MHSEWNAMQNIQASSG